MADIVNFGALSLATEESWYRQGRSEPRARRSFLTFLVDEEEYGLDLEHTREIIKVRPATELPRVPSFIAGVISVRGVVMPAIDLKQRLGMRNAGISSAARFLVVSQGDERFALLVDEVRQVIQLDEGEIEAAPPMLARSEAEFISGIGRTADSPDRLVILLDLAAVLRFDLRSRRAQP